MPPSALSPALALALLLPGCLQLPAGDDLTVAIAAHWTGQAPAFTLTLGAEAPVGLSVRVTDLTIGRSQTLLGPDLVTRYGQLLVPLGLGLAVNHTYRVEVRVGDATVAQRDFLARNGSATDGTPYAARGSYTFRMAVRNITPSESTELVLRGTGLSQGNRLRLDGDGFLNRTDAGMEMRLRIGEMQGTEGGDLPETLRLRASGTWRMDGAEGRGQGTVQEMLIESQGRESKAGADGVPRWCNRQVTLLRMAGQVDAAEVQVGVDSFTRTVEWTRVDTGEAWWVHEVVHENLTIDGETHGEVRERDEAADPATEPPALDAVTDWTGLVPHPLGAGDVFEARGLSGAAIEFVVTAAAPRTVAGTTFPALQVEGHAFGGVTGSQRSWIVASGELAGLVLSEHRAYTRGTESYDLRVEIVTAG